MRDLQIARIVYSIGFGLLAWRLCLLNAHALRRADALARDANERHVLRTELGSHRILALVSLAALLAASALYVFGPAFSNAWRALGGLPMWAYATLGLWMPWYHVRRERLRLALSTREAETA